MRRGWREKNPRSCNAGVIVSRRCVSGVGFRGWGLGVSRDVGGQFMVPSLKVSSPLSVSFSVEDVDLTTTLSNRRRELLAVMLV